MINVFKMPCLHPLDTHLREHLCLSYTREYTVGVKCYFFVLKCVYFILNLNKRFSFLFLRCSVVTEKSSGLLFTRPKKLIRSWGPEASVLGYVGIGTLSEGMCRYDLNEEDVAWLEVANREFTQMGEYVLNSILFRFFIFVCVYPEHSAVLLVDASLSAKMFISRLLPVCLTLIVCLRFLQKTLHLFSIYGENESGVTFNYEFLARFCSSDKPAIQTWL